MTPRTPLWLVLMTTATLLIGCDSANDDADAAAPVGDEQPASTDDRSAIADGPGLSVAVDEDDGEFTQEIPVVNASTLTAMRRQARAQRKVLVVDCWATWCGSCVAMFPKLHDAMAERDDVQFVTLTFDEGEDLTQQAEQFLTKHDAWANAYQATPDSDEKDAIAKALSENWGGGALPAVFVFTPDGKTAYELLETRGEVQDWVDAIAAAVDESRSE